MKFHPAGWLLVLILLLSSCTEAAQPTSTQIPGEPELSTATVQAVQPTDTAIPTQTATSIPPTSTLTPSFTPTSQPSETPTITPFPEKIVDQYGMSMVLVPRGDFIMGSDSWDWNERPAHTVYLDDYYIDQYEVSFQSYADFLNAEGNQFEGLANWVEAVDPDLKIHEVDGVWQVEPGFENMPMVEATWYGARAYCTWRGGRLPTEAEWEKAARGTDGRTYPWGEGISCERANYAGCNYGALPVDALPDGASPYGAYNMAGNVIEWTADIYDPQYYAVSPAENPTGPETGSFRVFRGGSWINNPGNVRTTYRYPKIQVLTYKVNGFRCARNAYP